MNDNPKEEQKLINDALNALQLPKTLLEIIEARKLHENHFPEEWLEDALKAVNDIAKSFKKLAKIHDIKLIKKKPFPEPKKRKSS